MIDKDLQDLGLIEIELMQQFPHISITDMDEILKYLEDKEFLNVDGKGLKSRLWERFIRK